MIYMHTISMAEVFVFSLFVFGLCAETNDEDAAYSRFA